MIREYFPPQLSFKRTYAIDFCYHNWTNMFMSMAGNEMDDYAKARYKDTKELTILKFIDDNGKMNPEISAVDFIQDGDLNKSLQHFVSII